MGLLIQFIGSFALFYNKVLLWKNNNIGWILGIIGITTLSWPVYQKHLWINLVYHAGLATLMIYGYLYSTGLKHQLTKAWNLKIRFILSLLTFGLCVYLFIETQNSKNFNEIQLFQATTGLAGVLFMAFGTRITKITGWIWNIASHFFATYLMIEKNLYIVAFFQILSVFVAILAIRKEIQTRPS